MGAKRRFAGTALDWTTRTRHAKQYSPNEQDGYKCYH